MDWCVYICLEGDKKGVAGAERKHRECLAAFTSSDRQCILDDARM